MQFSFGLLVVLSDIFSLTVNLQKIMYFQLQDKFSRMEDISYSNSGSPVLGDHNTGILVLCTILV
jgi:hypothetical protein